MEQIRPEQAEAKSLEERVSEVAEEQHQKLEKFFEMEFEKPKITLLDSREDMDKVKGFKTPAWMVGNTHPKTNEISIIREDKYESESSHKRREFWGTLRHEITHAAQGQIKEGEYRPLWFEEGVAHYLADQRYRDYDQEFLLRVNEYFDYKKGGDTGFYQAGNFWVIHLAETYGKEKLVQLVKSIRPGITPEKFQELFEKIYGFKFDDEYIQAVLDNK